jgi:DNA modification methylase
MGEMSGERPSGGYPPSGGQRSHVVTYGKPNKRGEQRFTHSKGTAARFFYQADYTYEQLEQANAVYYCAKASTERHPGLDDFYWRKDDRSPIDLVRITREEWEQLPEKKRAKGNIHPTCKPISLTKHLATLLAPPPGYAPRRLLVPFCGSGSECAGAILSGGWEHITGIDLVSEYCDIARSRLKWWQGWSEQTGEREPKALLKLARKAKKQERKSEQLELELDG